MHESDLSPLEGGERSITNARRPGAARLL